MGLDKKKVVLGMSGGVDSSVAALILQRMGYEVLGLSLILYTCDRPLGRACCTPSDRLDARRVCETLGICYEVIDLREDFKKEVIDYFAAEYAAGRTPLPCAPCNHNLRFKALADYADRKKAHWIATGHYAKVTHQEGRAQLLTAQDQSKDQSYFLFGLDYSILNRLLFPNGEMSKKEIRNLASRANLMIHDKPDSQELCFIGDLDHDEFIRSEYPELPVSQGNFVNEEGDILGRHRGLPAYTIGQRRGLKLSFGERRYVVGIDAQKNEVVLGGKESLLVKELSAKDLRWTGSRKIEEAFEAVVKIRSTHPGAKAKVFLENYHGARVVFDKPQLAAAPGQAAVFYSGEEVLGGGFIERIGR